MVTGDIYVIINFELDKFALTITSADDQDEKIVKVHMPGEMKTVCAQNLEHKSCIVTKPLAVKCLGYYVCQNSE